MTDAVHTDVLHLEAKLKDQLRGRVRNLRVFVHDNGLVLRGFSRTYHAKQLAQEAVLELPGLPLMANEIQVDAEPGYQRDVWTRE
jgi:hypothetical protein